MKTKLTKRAVALFESIKKTDDNGIEYWSSRDLWKILEYTEHRHFLPVIEKAKISCVNSGHSVSDHFEDILEMVVVGSNAERQMKSIKLSRYACYLTVQNADPNKPIVAQAHTYFAIQTRIAEVQQMKEYNKLMQIKLIMMWGKVNVFFKIIQLQKYQIKTDTCLRCLLRKGCISFTLLRFSDSQFHIHSQFPPNAVYNLTNDNKAEFHALTK